MVHTGGHELLLQFIPLRNSCALPMRQLEFGQTRTMAAVGKGRLGQYRMAEILFLARMKGKQKLQCNLGDAGDKHSGTRPASPWNNRLGQIRALVVAFVCHGAPTRLCKGWVPLKVIAALGYGTGLKCVINLHSATKEVRCISA